MKLQGPEPKTGVKVPPTFCQSSDLPALPSSMALSGAGQKVETTRRLVSSNEPPFLACGISLALGHKPSGVNS